MKRRTIGMTDREDGFRERKVRPKGWRKQAIKDGSIADPETMEKPTAAEIAGALYDLNAKRGDRDGLIDLLSECRDHVLDKVDGRFVMVRLPSPKKRWDDAAQDWVLDEDDDTVEFAPPSAVVEQEQE
jgi:hypothetical protein